MASLVPASPYADSPRSEMLAFIPAGTRRLLDVGCHTGQFGRAVKSRFGAEIWGVEPNPTTAEVARSSLDRVLNGFFAPDLDLPDHYFDVIVFNDVLEHMPDPWGALRLAANKLTPGGSIVVSLPNLRHIDNLVHIFKERDFQYEPWGIRDITHLRFYTRKSIPRLFSDSGLMVERIAGINEEWWTPSLLRRLAFRMFPAYLEDTRFIQFAIVAKPPPPTAAQA